MENASFNKTTLNWLYDSARWAKFIAIIGFIFVAFFIVIAIFMGPVLSYLNEDIGISTVNPLLSSGFFPVFYLILSAIYFFPVYFLFKFSDGVIRAYKADDEEGLNTSFQFLKKHFKFIGILLIIVLAIYVLAFAVGIGAMVAGLF